MPSHTVPVAEVPLGVQSCGAGGETGVSISAPNISGSVTEAQTTVSIQLQGPIDPYRFNMFMADLLAERGCDIKRMYGVLSIQVRHTSSNAARLALLHPACADDHIMWSRIHSSAAYS